jgi:hypothetical protein
LISKEVPFKAIPEFWVLEAKARRFFKGRVQESPFSRDAKKKGNSCPGLAT